MSNEQRIMAIWERDYISPPEYKPIRFCDCCESPLYEGDAVWEIGDEVYCETCAKDNFKKILVR